jgi:hypothetical protein
MGSAHLRQRNIGHHLQMAPQLTGAAAVRRHEAGAASQGDGAAV